MLQIDSSLIQALPVPASLLGESPCWHPSEQVLYWCDIPGQQLHRFEPRTGAHRHWSFEVEPSCCAPLQDGGLLLAMRDGLWRFDTESDIDSESSSAGRSLLVEAPYDRQRQRFNDGKADAHGRFWVGTLDERREPQAALYRCADGQLQRMAAGITVSNALAWSPDGATMYWADTRAHRVHAFDVDVASGSLSRQRVFAQFSPRVAGPPLDADLDSYGGRPDGAAVDVEGAYWLAMFEGSRLLRMAPDGGVLAELKLPVRCPTMPCFGGHDLRTLYITTSRENRPAAELARQPLAGCVLQLRVAVPGLPVNFAVL